MGLQRPAPPDRERAPSGLRRPAPEPVAELDQRAERDRDGDRDDEGDERVLEEAAAEVADRGLEGGPGGGPDRLGDEEAPQRESQGAGDDHHHVPAAGDELGRGDQRDAPAVELVPCPPHPLGARSLPRVALDEPGTEAPAQGVHRQVPDERARERRESGITMVDLGVMIGYCQLSFFH